MSSRPTNKYRALYLVEVGKLELREEEPTPLAETKVRIKVGACTICRSDIEWLLGHRKYRMPGRFGHEVAGTVVEVGAAVEGINVGDRVFSRSVHGGYADYADSEARNIAPLPNGIGFEEGAIAQLLPIAVHGIEISVRRKDSVLVSGLGAAGLLCVQVAKAYGAELVIAADLYEKKRRLALELGADEVIDASTEDVVAATKKLTGSGVDVAVEAVGIEKSFRQCEEAVKGGGVIAVFGTHAKPICLDMIRWEGRSLRMKIMREQPHETPRLLRRCVQLLSSGAVKLKPLLTGVFSLADFEKAFEEAISHPEAHIKIAIVP